ncbi:MULTISPECIES: MarR family transcriptional regulator [unclassified Streptomyces]|uniref:MarR family winged helix-turn-helix transcriptional regulator n=1 Tax=unclassified Streptomyces TaxID=2593676 RepID=UPI0033DBB798
MDDVRWLDSYEQETWRAYHVASQLLVESLDRRLQRDAQMPHAYYLILAMLSEAPSRTMTMTRLAQQVHAPASRLSHAATKLESHGWIRRHRDPDCGRTTLATLTDEGFSVLTETAPGYVRQVRSAFFDRLTPEQVRQLHSIFTSLLTEFEQEGQH